MIETQQTIASPVSTFYPNLDRFYSISFQSRTASQQSSSHLSLLHNWYLVQLFPQQRELFLCGVLGLVHGCNCRFSYCVCVYVCVCVDFQRESFCAFACAALVALLVRSFLLSFVRSSFRWCCLWRVLIVDAVFGKKAGCVCTVFPADCAGQCPPPRIHAHRSIELN